MQAKEDWTAKVFIPMEGGSYSAHREDAWLHAMDQAIIVAKAFAEAGYHKQIVNRLLEPFSHINVVVTATEWANFYALRRHEDAQPEIKMLADLMWDAQQDSTPKLLQPGDWHMPYVEPEDWEHAYMFARTGRITRDLPSRHEVQNLLLKVTVSRCARVSYMTFDGKRSTVEEDIKLADKLLASTPLHASPAEHQATPDEFRPSSLVGVWKNSHQHGNLRGWIQHRKMLPNEFVRG